MAAKTNGSPIGAVIQANYSTPLNYACSYNRLHLFAGGIMAQLISEIVLVSKKGHHLIYGRLSEH